MNNFQELQHNSTNNFDPTRTQSMIGGPSHQIRPIDEQEINQGIAQGFGQFFFNGLDPEIAKTNVPFKQDSETHMPILVITILMICGIIVGIVLLQFSNLVIGGIIVIAVPYLIYLLGSIACSQIRGYITNLKKFNDYKQTYDKMVKGRGYFRFWVECYHYRTRKTKKGTRSEKVVTYTMTQDYYPSQSVDQSGDVTGIQDITKYVFVKYLKKFYFSNQQSEVIFNNAYRAFIDKNKKDTHQNHTHTFEVEGFEEEVGFCMLGESPHNCLIYYLLTFLGLAFPYSYIMEKSVSRYNIFMLKRLTC